MRNSPIKYKHLSKKLTEPGTNIYKKGKLIKKGDGPINYNWSERFVLLENTNFIYYAEEEENQKIPKRIVFLQGAKVERYEELDIEYGFVLIPSDNSKPLYLSGLTEDENEEWFNVLTVACEMCKIEFGDVYELDEKNTGYGGIASSMMIKDGVEVKENLKNENLVLLSTENSVRVYGIVDDTYENYKNMAMKEKNKQNMLDFKSYFNTKSKNKDV